MIDFLSKVVRRLIEMDLIGNRFLSLVNTGINYDRHSKRIYQKVEDEKIYLARCSHGVPSAKGRDMIEWLNKEVYFSKYMPSGNDVYVDIGSGYGHELVYVAKNSPGVTILGIEANPEVFQYCKASTSAFKNIRIYNLMIGDQDSYQLSFMSNYAGKGANDDGFITCQGSKLIDVLGAENIDRISLLKLNIEGGERDIIESLPYSRVDNLIISCHDFRSERGDGEFYRTYDSVKTNLISYGYSISDISPSMVPSKEWAASLKYWIFATKK
jgi:FkbM family methyltransferase|tara:strand:+ start:3647 stop:4456 length:810 start_codon:yes stop_codon:yes gene_type:complete